MRALQGDSCVAERLVTRGITKRGDGGSQRDKGIILRGDQRLMRRIVARCANTIGDTEKFLSRAACAQQCRLAGDLIIGEQAARPGRLTACRRRRVHGAPDFLAHFIYGRKQCRTKHMMRGTKCRNLACCFLPRFLFGFKCGAKLAEGGGKAGAGGLDRG